METEPGQQARDWRCTPDYGHWQYKKALSVRPVSEKTEATIKWMCDVYGYQTFFLVVLVIGLIFHRQIWDILKSKRIPAAGWLDQKTNTNDTGKKE